jgi:flagellar biogenesis protein FliO
VADYKKNFIASVLAVVLVAAAPIPFFCQVNPAEATELSVGNTNPPSANATNLKPTQSYNLSSRELFYRMMLSVIVIIVLGGATIYISKRFLPKIVSQQGKNIRISETTHLGHNKTLHLLTIGSQRLLIGSTSQSITLLADVTNAFTNEGRKETNKI